MSFLKSFLSRIFDAICERDQAKQPYKCKYEQMTDKELFQLYKSEKDHRTVSSLAYEALKDEVAKRIKQQQSNG